MKTWLMCLAFNDVALVEESLNELYKKNDKTLCELGEYEVVIVDCCFPYPSAGTNALALVEIARQFGATLLRPYRNRGVAGNWQWFMNEVGCGDNDIIIGIDPDERPQQDNWLLAIKNVLTADKNCYYVGLNQPGYKEHFAGKYEKQTIGGEAVFRYKQLINWSVGGFCVNWVKKIGGFGQYNALYGHIEQYFHDKCKGGHFLILEDHINHHIDTTCKPYADWKLASARKETELDFADWLTSYNG